MSSLDSERLPILLWGDLIKGSKPVLRRALAGARAHECMYAWVYLTDYLALHRLRESIVASGSHSRRLPGELFPDRLWSGFDRKMIDPNQQIDAADFEVMAQIASLAAAHDEPRPLFVELGPSFFGARLKFEIVDTIASGRFPDWPKIHPDWLGIENSQFMRDAIRALDRETEITLLDDYSKFEGSDRFSLFYSRFVATYAFPSAIEFARWLVDRFSAAIVEDAHSTTSSDVRVTNHGQHETFFSARDSFRVLEDHDFEIHVLDTYPDHPAGSGPCHVVRYLAIRKGLQTERYLELLSGLGFPFDPTATRVRANEVPQRFNDAVSAGQWRRVRRAKRESPVWGRTSESSGRERLHRTWYALRRRFKRPGPWQRHRLEGPMARAEVERALRER